jgi:hypothetical protein
MGLLLLCFLHTAVFAQEGGTESTSSTTSTKTEIKVTDGDANWYASPWVWVVGGAVFILLLVALTRGGGSRRESGTTDRVTVTKTVHRDTDTDTRV